MHSPVVPVQKMQKGISSDVSYHHFKYLLVSFDEVSDLWI